MVVVVIVGKIVVQRVGEGKVPTAESGGDRILAEIAVVEPIFETQAGGGGGEAEQAVVGLPFQPVGASSLPVDNVGVEVTAEIYEYLFEQGGSAAYAHRCPVHGVGHEIVGGGDVETFQKGDFLQIIRSILVFLHLHFQFVANAERGRCRRAVGGHPI